MSTRTVVVWGLATLSLAGCLSPVRQEVDGLVCQRAGLAVDLPPPGFIPPPVEVKPRPPIDPSKPPTLLERFEVSPQMPGSEAPKLILPANFSKLSEKDKE